MSMFRRRPIEARDLPPVPVPAAPTSTAVTSSVLDSLRAAEARLRAIAEAGDETTDLTAVVRPGTPLFREGRYEVTYDRLGPYGRRGAPRPVPLTASAATLDDLTAVITRDAARYLDDDTVVVITDLQVMGGTIRAHGASAGTFTLRRISSAAAPRQETTEQ